MHLCGCLLARLQLLLFLLASLLIFLHIPDAVLPPKL
jgi:hypothetical protein